MPKDKSTITRSADDSLRAANRDDGQEQGIIEGYFARWGQIDSHNTRFQRGCFARSISERMNKIVIRNSHGNPIGKPLEIREDAEGAYFSGQVSLSVQEAREAYDLVRDEVVTGLSFGFQNVNDKIESDGVRTFTEVKLLEISPTWLPSGDESRITNVRSEENIEERSIDFDETVLEETSHMLWHSIQNTIGDIWWEWSWDDLTNAEALSKVDEALSNFRDSYVEFASQWVQAFGTPDEGFRSLPDGRLQLALATSIKSEERSVEEYCAEHSLSQENFELLRRGQYVADLKGTAGLPTELRTLNNQLRADKFEDGFTQLRQYMSSGELKRSNALLSVCGTIEPSHKKDNETELRSDDILSALKKINGDDNNV